MTQMGEGFICVHLRHLRICRSLAWLRRRDSKWRLSDSAGYELPAAIFFCATTRIE